MLLLLWINCVGILLEKCVFDCEFINFLVVEGLVVVVLKIFKYREVFLV